MQQVVKNILNEEQTELSQGVSKIQLTAAIAEAKNSIIEQSNHIERLADQLDNEFNNAVSLIAKNKGRLIVSGMGKSGHIGKKIAATFASTGTPAFFVHPAEAFHGDLGMIQPSDLVLLLSNSGETDEVLKLIPSLQRFGNKIISISGSRDNTLAKNSHAAIMANVAREICPNNLAPTSSTTAALVMGDALAIALIKLRNFLPHHFAMYHPGGSLGRKLLTKVKDVMHTQSLPFVDIHESMSDVILVMTTSSLGIAIVTDSCQLKGIITDGDLRRALIRHTDFSQATASDLMTTNPVTIEQDKMLVEAEEIMRTRHIKHMLVLDKTEVVGVLEFFQQ